MIYTYIPYAPKEQEKNLGWAYNNFMETLYSRDSNDDDWVCFLDHDAMFTVDTWYLQLEEIIKETPDAGLFTVVTNRIGNVEQQVGLSGNDINNHDLYFHRTLGRFRQEHYGNSIRECKGPISGVVILTNKKVWKDAGGFADGFLSVDNKYDFSVRNAGYKTYIMEGVYCYHWYRGDGQPMRGYFWPPEAHLPPIEAHLPPIKNWVGEFPDVCCKFMSAFLETVLRLDANDNVSEFLQFIQSRQNDQNEMLYAIYQLLVMRRLRSAFILAMLLANSGSQNLIISVALSIGGLVYNNPEEEKRGLENLRTQMDVMPVKQKNRIYDHIVVPSMTLLVLYSETIGIGNKDRVLRFLEILNEWGRSRTA